MTNYRIINVFLDGTANHPEQETNGKWTPTNIYRQYKTLSNIRYSSQFILPENIAISAYYHRGIGARRDKEERASIHRVFDHKTTPEDAFVVDHDLEEKVDISLKQKFAQAVGFGLTEIMLNAYRHVSEQVAIAKNDRAETYLQSFGFSRGAATARTLTAMLSLVGPSRIDDNGKALEEDVNIGLFLYMRRSELGIQKEVDKFVREKDLDIARTNFIGVYDTVPALGAPNSLPRLKSVIRAMLSKTELAHDHHDFSIPKYVDVARHALAADELRVEFDSNVWDKDDPDGVKCDMEQRTFASSHCEIGGSVIDRGIPDLTISWMMNESQKTLDAKLSKDSVPVFTLDPKLVCQGRRPNSMGKINIPHKKLPYNITYWLDEKRNHKKFRRDFTGAAKLTKDPSLNYREYSSNYEPAAIIPKETSVAPIMC